MNYEEFVAPYREEWSDEAKKAAEELITEMLDEPTDWKGLAINAAWRVEELESTLQRVRDAADHLDAARDQGLVYTYGQIQHTLRKALEGDPQ